MSLEDQATENLFSYGTLQDEGVQLSTFGRRLEGRPDTLAGYRLKMISIKDLEFVKHSGSKSHRTLVFTGLSADQVEGSRLSLTRRELAQADGYEPDGYERVAVELESKIKAWVYINGG